MAYTEDLPKNESQEAVKLIAAAAAYVEARIIDFGKCGLPRADKLAAAMLRGKVPGEIRIRFEPDSKVELGIYALIPGEEPYRIVDVSNIPKFSQPSKSVN